MACGTGSLDVAKWLYFVGAAEDVRTRTKLAALTPMCIAAFFGHLHVVKWLFEVGSAEDIRTLTTQGNNPLKYAALRFNHSVVTWLVLHGAASDEFSGHVDHLTLFRDMPTAEKNPYRKTVSGENKKVRSVLCKDIVALLYAHQVFTSLILPATRFGRAAEGSFAAGVLNKLSPLTALCGHEETLLVLIADYLGVIRKRQLRNAREAREVLLAARWRSAPVGS